jgi:acetyl-CoA carboxylase carboxyltransferase component
MTTLGLQSDELHGKDVADYHARPPLTAVSATTARAGVHDQAHDESNPLEKLHALRQRLYDGPGVDATARQHARGKLTARERIDLLLDKGSFQEIEGFRRHRAVGMGLEQNRPHSDGVVTGWGRIDGRTVFVYAHDFRIFGGSLGEAHAEKIHKVMDLAFEARAPIIGINDGAGARIQEGVSALAGYGGIFRRIVRASGVIPQISVMMGPCAGGAAYAPALTDFVFMVHQTSQMFITGPDVIRAVTGEQVTANMLGGAEVHTRHSGVSAFAYDDEETCLAEVRYLLSFLPSSIGDPSPTYACDDPIGRMVPELADIVPTDPRAAYNVAEVIAAIVDDGEMLEINEQWARNIVCALGRMDGHSVGFLANQPAHLAGALDIAASDKGARFISMCDAFGIPIVTLVDVPGFLPGVDQERDGIIRSGAKLLYAYCNSTVPRAQVIIRKAYGGAYIVMDSRSIGCDVSFAWPTNEIAVMGAEAAAEVIHRKSIAAADNPQQHRERLVAEYKSELMHPLYAAERGLIDDIIDPAETRHKVANTLEMLRSKGAGCHQVKKHGNPPQ